MRATVVAAVWALCAAVDVVQQIALSQTGNAGEIMVSFATDPSIDFPSTVYFGLTCRSANTVATGSSFVWSTGMAT